MPTTEKIFFWNAYNLFQGNGKSWTAQPDKKFAEESLASGGSVFTSRVHRMADRLVDFSGNAAGPEVLGMCELEMSSTTLESIRDTLNTYLSTTYTLAYQETRSDRAICTALFTRWTVVSTKVLTVRWRVIEVALTRYGTPITIYVCHWPSRISDADGEQRQLIARSIYENVVLLGSGKRVIVMGDFNDTPTDPSVATELHAGSSTAAAFASVHPSLVLYNFMTDGSLAGQFTHSHEGSDQIIDHIVSTGTLLSSSNPVLSGPSIYTSGISQSGKPWKHNTEPPGGYSDHFPISVDITWS